QLSLPGESAGIVSMDGWPWAWELDEPATSGRFRLLQQTNREAADSHKDPTQQSPPHQELRLPFRQIERHGRFDTDHCQNHPQGQQQTQMLGVRKAAPRV